MGAVVTEAAGDASEGLDDVSIDDVAAVTAPFEILQRSASRLPGRCEMVN